MNIRYFYLKDSENFVTQLAKLVDEQVEAWISGNPTGVEIDLETYDLLSSIRLGRYQVVGNEFVPVYDRTPLEDQWLLVRLQRDEKLQQSDWTVIRAVDEGNPIPTDWQTYRQQLREITNQTDPFHIIWPVAPN
jgi:hypothetical protein